MQITFYNAVVLAENYDLMVDWYIKTFNLRVKYKVEKDYHYAELVNQNDNLVIGIAQAKEMEVKPNVPHNNCIIIQLTVGDIKSLFKHVEKNNGKIIFGPSLDSDKSFLYGGINDIENNQIWVTENKSNK